MRVLAGDIGGTKTHLALAEIAPDGIRVLAHERYESRAYSHLDSILDAFVSEVGRGFERAGFGVAGPVVDGVCKATNLPWIVDEQAIATRFGTPARLVNDFFAVAIGVEALRESDLVMINPGEAAPRAPKAILGAGTGLGEAFLVWQGQRYAVVPSEGGHADFAPRNEREIGLLRELIARHGRASYERVVSGKGLAEVYAYLRDAKVAPESATIRAELEAGADVGAVVGRHALAGDDPLCKATMELFVDAFGAQAGNLALTLVARGGVYVAGGIAPKILPLLTNGRFREAFVHKGRLRPLLESIPLYVVVHSNVGLLGAGLVAAE